jgi:hypothetical protein
LPCIASIAKGQSSTEGEDRRIIGERDPYGVDLIPRNHDFPMLSHIFFSARPIMGLILLV